MIEKENLSLREKQNNSIKYETIVFEEGEIDDSSLKVLEVRPEPVISKTPAIIAPGWSLTIPLMQKSAETFGSKGRRALTFDHRREQTLSSISKDPNEPTESLQRAFEVLAVLKQQNIEEPVNGIGYSEGGIDLLLAAKLEPQRFRNIILVAPGGMLGKDNALKLAARFTKGAVKDVLSAAKKPETISPIMKYTKELAKYLGKNIAMAYREVDAIAGSDVAGIVKELSEKGIGISFICGTDDMVFPMYAENKNGTIKEKTVQKQAGRVYQEQKKEGKKSFSGFYSVKGGHAEFMLHPERYTDLIEEALRTLEKIKSK